MASALVNLSLRKGRGRGERREERREEKKIRNEIGVRLALFGGPLAFHDFFRETSRDFRFCVISEVSGLPWWKGGNVSIRFRIPEYREGRMHTPHEFRRASGGMEMSKKR